MYLPSDVVAKYYAGTGFAYDKATNMYRSRLSSGLKPLGVRFAGTTFTWATADILVPHADYKAFGLQQG